jgi:hypothetical protein
LSHIYQSTSRQSQRNSRFLRVCLDSEYDHLFLDCCSHFGSNCDRLVSNWGSKSRSR